MTKAKAKTIIKMGVPDQETINEILAGAGGKYVAVEAFKVPTKNGEFTLRAYRINALQPVERVPEEQRQRDAAQYKEFVKKNLIRLVDQAAVDEDDDGKKTARKQYSGAGGGTVSFYWQRVQSITANGVRYEFTPIDLCQHPGN